MCCFMIQELSTFTKALKYHNNEKDNKKLKLYKSFLFL